jgi:hypothetical protein
MRRSVTAARNEIRRSQSFHIISLTFIIPYFVRGVELVKVFNRTNKSSWYLDSQWQKDELKLMNLKPTEPPPINIKSNGLNRPELL